MKSLPAHRRIQALVVGLLAALLLLYSTDQVSGVAHDVATPGLAKSRQWVAETRAQLRADPPEVVVLGNSMVGWGFDDDLFEQLSQAKTTRVWRKGAGSAWFYLALKNLVLAESRPRMAIVVFRDNVLTRPELRVWGKFKHDLDALAAGDTALLDELSYLNHKNAEYYFTNYLPLYAERSLWSDRLKFALEQQVSEKLLGIELGELIFSLNRKFSFNGIKYRELGNQSYYQSTRLEPEALDFERNLEASYLPHIVELCRRHGVELVTVRIQRLVDFEGLRDTAQLERYIEGLADYAGQQGFAFIDSTGQGWLERGDYPANDHLHASGRARFTEAVYREIEQRKLLAARR